MNIDHQKNICMWLLLLALGAVPGDISGLKYFDGIRRLCRNCREQCIVFTHLIKLCFLHHFYVILICMLTITLLLLILPVLVGDHLNFTKSPPTTKLTSDHHTLALNFRQPLQSLTFSQSLWKCLSSICTHSIFI